MAIQTLTERFDNSYPIAKPIAPQTGGHIDFRNICNNVSEFDDLAYVQDVRREGLITYELETCKTKRCRKVNDVWTWEVLSVAGENIGNNTNEHHYEGDTAPEDTTSIWFDSSTDVPPSFIDALLQEVKATISAMAQQIIALETRVKYLELNEGGGTPPLPPLPSIHSSILLENGEQLLLEDGSLILLEVQKVISNNLLLENNDYLLFENGQKIDLEL